MPDRTKDKNKRRAYLAKWQREHRKKLGKTEMELAKEAGQLDALHRRKREEERQRRRRRWEKEGRPKRGPQPLAVVKVDAIASPDAAQGYPELGALVKEWAPRLFARHRNRHSARAMMYVFESALQSLPVRPTELEYRAWFLALNAGNGPQRYAPSTINRFREFLNTLYEYARVRGGPWHNPLADVEPLRDDRAKLLPLTERNVRTYYDRAMQLLDDVRDRGVVAVLRFTGIRIGEVLGLQAQDIDLSDPQLPRLHIIRQRFPHTYAPGPLKHVRQRRFVPIHPELLARLNDILRLGPAKVRMGHHLKGELRECPYLFPQRAKALKKLARKLKLMLPEGEWPEGQAFHAFRHAWAIEAHRKARMPLEEISRWLGHSSIAVTQAYLQELMGYDAPVTSLERLWAAQSGEPVPVERTAFGLDDPRPSTKSHPARVLRVEFPGGPSDGRRR